VPPPVRTPVQWTFYAFALGLACLAGKALLGDPDGFGERFGSDCLSVLAGVAFGVAGLNEVGRRWLRRPWTELTARTVFDYMGLLVNELAAIAAGCYAVVEPITEDKPTLPVGWAFSLPDADSQEQVYESYKGVLDHVQERVETEPETARMVIDRARIQAPLISEHVERSRTLMAEISAYRVDQSAALAELGVSLWSQATGLQDALDMPRNPAVHVIAGLRVLLFESRQVALVLSDGFRDVWKVVSNDDQGGAVIVTNRHASLDAVGR
jgi:hypothetical protein